MIYKKDPKLKYTDMCIYIDNHIYSGDYDADLVYQYLYLIIYMLASKKHYFKQVYEYEDFSLWCARKLFLRLTVPEELDADGNPKEGTGKIRSILNYAKTTTGFNVLYYRKECYSTVIRQEELGDKGDVGSYLTEYYANSINAQKFEIIHNDFNDLFKTLPSMIKEELKRGPYRNVPQFNDLYLSCLLSYLYSITPIQGVLNKVKKKAEKKGIDADFASTSKQILKKEIVLWNMASSCTPYIEFVVNKVTREITSSMRDIMDSVYSEEELKDIVGSTYSDLYDDGFGG